MRIEGGGGTERNREKKNHDYTIRHRFKSLRNGD